MKEPQKPTWLSQGRYGEADNDPLTGFANIMDIMLVFALGLMLALISQHQQLRETYLSPEKSVPISKGRSLNKLPEAMGESMQSGQGMQSLGQVYRDPETGKLILIEHNQ